MYDSPAYVWAIIIAGPTAIAATTCIALYGGAKRAGLGRRRAALLAGGHGRPARRLVHRQRGDRGSRLVPHAANGQAQPPQNALFGHAAILLSLAGGESDRLSRLG